MKGDPMTTACAGLQVLDLTQGMVAMATMILADNGAEVIKVEPPGGDWARDEPGFLMWNRGKQSIALDLTREADRAVAHSLAERADVLIESFRPGVAQRLGLGYEALSARNSRLVYCSISSFGPTGPLSQLKGYEGAVAAKIGRMIGLDRMSGAVPGQDRAFPIYTAAPVASFGAAQLAVQGIVAALLARRATGRGQKVETSLLQASAAFLLHGLARGADGVVPGTTPPTIRRGIELCFLRAECSDGKYIQMCARQDHHFRDWMKAIGLAQVLEDPTYAKAPLGILRMGDIEALEGRILEKMRQQPQAEWMRRFIEEYDVGADPFLTPEEFLAHPQMVQNERVVEIDDPTVGRTRQIGPLVTFSSTPSVIGQPAPRLDEHGSAIRARADQTNGDPKPAPSSQPGAPPRRPLTGVTILEIAYFLAGPFSTAILADMGARVIKVEPLDGDPFRRTGLGFSKMVHGKESIAVNLKSAAGIRIVHQLAERSDALMHSFRPGVPERLQIDYATLSALNPRLVYLYGGSYGSKGPQSHRAAMHSTPHALNGGGFLQAGADNPPADDSYPDPGSGLGAGTALLLGLLARDRIGAGQALETTMLCSSGYVLSGDLVLYDGMPPRQIPDKGQHGLDALERLYPCRAGWIFLAVRQEKEWRALAKVLDHPDLLADPRFATRADRLRHDSVLVALLANIFRTRPADEWERVLSACDLAAVRADQEPYDDFLLHHNLLIPMEHPDFGAYWHTAFTVDFSEAPNRIAPATGIGEYTRALLAELGYGPADVERLFAENIVR